MDLLLILASENVACLGGLSQIKVRFKLVSFRNRNVVAEIGFLILNLGCLIICAGFLRGVGFNQNVG